MLNRLGLSYRDYKPPLEAKWLQHLEQHHYISSFLAFSFHCFILSHIIAHNWWFFSFSFNALYYLNILTFIKGLTSPIYRIQLWIWASYHLGYITGLYAAIFYDSTLFRSAGGIISLSFWKSWIKPSAVKMALSWDSCKYILESLS